MESVLLEQVRNSTFQNIEVLTAKGEENRVIRSFFSSVITEHKYELDPKI